MKKLLLTIAGILTIGTGCIAQNLVSNGSFESKTGSECPNQTGFDHGYPTDWSVPFHGYTPDYFYPCAAPGTSYYPGQNGRGCEPPLHGQAYAGFLALEAFTDGDIHPAGSEYIKHSVTLTSGQQYYIEFWVSRADDSNGYNGYTASVKTLGMFLTRNLSDFNTSGNGLHHLIPQIPSTFPATSYYTSNNGWTKISGYFTPAQGGTWHLVIGNFDSYLSQVPATNTPNTTPSNGYRKAFYFVDGVTIIPSNQTPPHYAMFIGANDPICYGEPATVVLANIPFGTSVTWSVSPNLFAVSSGSGGTATLSVINPATSGQGAITYNLQGPCGNSTLSSYFWVGKPSGLIDGPWQVYPDQVYLYTANTLGSPYYFEWYITGSGYNWGWSNRQPQVLVFWSGQGTSGSVDLVSANACGTTNTSLNVAISSEGGCNPCQIVTPYPNPSDKEFDVSIKTLRKVKPDETLIYRVSLFNSLQETVFDQMTEGQNLKIPTEKLPEGIYLLRVISKAGDATVKQIQIKR